MRAQTRQFSAETATIQLGGSRQILRVEGLHSRSKNVLSTYNAQEHDKIATVKNWLGRKRLHYIESITEAEKQVCGTLQGLFDTLSAMFWPQFSEMIKSLQFRKLCRVEDESAEEWM